jgi:hypothetical protein
MTAPSHGDAEERASALRPLRPEELIAALERHRVEFIVVGGFALAAHGVVRATKDVDICPNPAEDNLERLAGALAELDAEVIGLEELEGEFDLRPTGDGLALGGNWLLLTKHGRLDLMQALEGADGGYDHLARGAVERDFLGHRVRFCGYEDLVAMKAAADRPQDRVDLADLRAARGEA